MSIRCFLIAATVAFGPVTTAGCDDATAPRPPAPAATASLSWLDQTGSLIAAGRMNPLAAGRVYAAVSVAQYRAAKAAAPLVGVTGYEARTGAVAAASAQVLSFLFPAAADSLGRALAALGAAYTGSAQVEFARGVTIGKAVGDEMVARVKADGFTRAWTGSAPTGTGIWTPVTSPPSGVMLGSVTPYFLTSGSQFRPAAPPAYGSAAFEADLNEVLQFGQNRTNEQIALAKAWDYSAGTTTAVGYWSKAAAEHIAQKGMDELDATRVFGLMHAAVFDAQIACWDAKYHYWLARPYQANTAITTVLPAPNHPSYPSGHSCVGSSAARVLGEFFPEKKADLAKLVSDAGMSRIYAGIHYRFDVTTGQQLGTSVAEWVLGRSNSL